MFILVAGGGKIGYYLVRDLVQKGHELLLIERDKKKCTIINEELGTVALCGDACDPMVQEIAGIKRADLVVAVTGEDEDNLVICQVAKSKFKVPFTIARINNPRNKEIFAQLGVDATVSQTEVLLTLLEEMMTYKGILTSFPVVQGVDVEMVEVLMPENSPAAGKSLKELALPKDCTVSMVVRNKELVIPDGSTVLEAKDLVVALVKKENSRAIRQLLLGETLNQMEIDFTKPNQNSGGTV